MKQTKLLTFVEALCFISLLTYIISNWFVNRPTLGDYFCLELFAMLSWYVYDTIKTNINNKKD